jgi:hypothetical protein
MSDKTSPSRFSLLTAHFSLLLRISRGQCHPIGDLAVQTNLEGVLSGAGKWHVEHQHGTGLDVDHAGGGFTELYRPLATQELAAAVVHETDSYGVDADLGAPAADPQHQVGARVHRREVREPDVLKHTEHAKLALLIDQGVVRNDREIEMQFS